MTTPRLRPGLDAVPAYVPGRRPAAIPGVTPYKLSSNENPYPPMPSVLAALEDAAGDVNRYPDMFATEMVTAIAEHHGVPLSHVAVGTGSVGVLQQLVQAVAGEGDEVVHAWRSFEAYPIVLAVNGAVGVPVPLTADERHDLDAMAAAIGPRTRMVLLCSPNNPTGTAITKDELDRFLAAVPDDVLVVLDEAYVEFVRGPADVVVDGVAAYRDHPNLCVLRTFSKAYGLAGLRVGYAIAHEPVAEALRKTAVPFGVSGLAQHAVLASLDAEDELLARVDLLVSARTEVAAALRDQGWTVADTQANFVWLRLGERSAEFADRCADVGLAVRAFPGEGVRVTIGEPGANVAFLDVAGSVDPV
jgi:histidinol-phosphate aminotransferase